MRTEVYTEPVPEKKFQAFVGGGTSLGTVKSEGLGVNKDVAFHVDKSQPTTNINFRLEFQILFVVVKSNSSCSRISSSSKIYE